jgi:hypothetical protein
VKQNIHAFVADDSSPRYVNASSKTKAGNLFLVQLWEYTFWFFISQHVSIHMFLCSYSHSDHLGSSMRRIEASLIL